MSATPQQIAAARQLASSRGYDPNLVDEDNADRANTAFPVQSGGYTGGSGYQPPPGTPLAAPSTSPTGAGGAIAASSTDSGAAAGGGGVSGIAPALSGLKSAGPSANASASDTGSMFGMPDATQPVASPAMGPLNLRDGLGTRLYPNENSPLAALRKIY